jgi:hypothetical protein
MPTFPSVSNNTLGIAPETLNQFWQQFAFTGFPNGMSIGTIASDMSVSLNLTAAQLLALQTTAVQLVAPPVTTGGTISVPPAGYLYVPTTLTAQYDFEGTAFTIASGDNAFQIEYTGKAVSLLSMLVTGLVDQAADTVATNTAPAAGTKFAATNAANLGLEVKLVGTTPALTLGNGNVTLNMLYNVYCLF